MAVSRRHVDPVTGIVYANQAERDRAIKARENAATTTKARREFESAQYDDPRRLDQASDMMRAVREGVGMAYVERSVSAPPSSPVPAGTRQFGVGLFKGNRAQDRPPEATVTTTFWQKVQRFMAETGTTDTDAAIRECQRLYPEDAQRHSPEQNTATDRIIGQSSGEVVRLFDQAVTEYRQSHGCTLEAAILEVGRTNRDLAERRNRALTLPLVNGVAMTSNR
jgi:hypothetical protein